MQKEQVKVPEHMLQIRRNIQKAQRLLRSQFPAETDNQKMEARLAEALSKPEIGVLPPGSGVAQLNRLREKLLMDYEEVAYEILDSEGTDVDTQVSALAGLLHTEPEQELHMERVHLKEAIDKALESLTPREERVLRMRFFQDLMLDEVADTFGVSRGRIQQIEASALRRLRHPARGRSLTGFITRRK